MGNFKEVRSKKTGKVEIKGRIKLGSRKYGYSSYTLSFDPETYKGLEKKAKDMGFRCVQRQIKADIIENFNSRSIPSERFKGKVEGIQDINEYLEAVHNIFGTPPADYIVIVTLKNLEKWKKERRENLKNKGVKKS